MAIKIADIAPRIPFHHIFRVSEVHAWKPITQQFLFFTLCRMYRKRNKNYSLTIEVTAGRGDFFFFFIRKPQMYFNLLDYRLILVTIECVCHQPFEFSAYALIRGNSNLFYMLISPVIWHENQIKFSLIFILYRQNYNWYNFKDN